MSFSKPSFFGSNLGTGTNLTGILGSSTSGSAQRTAFGGLGGSSGSNTSPLFGSGGNSGGGIAGLLGGNSNSVTNNIFGGSNVGGVLGSGSQSGTIALGGLTGGGLTGMSSSGGLFGGSIGMATVGSASNVPHISPGTQVDEFKVHNNKDGYEVYCYNFSDKLNSYSLKMLRLQDYMNFKNNQIMDKHKGDVSRYFQHFKNHKMAPQQGNAIGSGLMGGSTNIFGGGPSAFGASAGSGLTGGGSNTLVASGSGGGLGNLFGQNQVGQVSGGRMNIFGQQSQGNQLGGNIFGQNTNLAGSGPNIFGQNNQLQMSTGMGEAPGGGFNNIFAGSQQTAVPQILNAFGQPVGGGSAGGLFGGGQAGNQNSLIGNMFNNQVGQQMGSMNQQLSQNTQGNQQVHFSNFRMVMVTLAKVLITVDLIMDYIKTLIQEGMVFMEVLSKEQVELVQHKLKDLEVRFLSISTDKG